jgi:hypothetical protein
MKRSAEHADYAGPEIENIPLFAGHFPFPGLESIHRQGDGFVWIPDP